MAMESPLVRCFFHQHLHLVQFSSEIFHLFSSFPYVAMFSTFYIPSGKRLHNYGKSPFFMGKSTINGHFQ